MNSINICHSLSADANGVIKDLGFPTQVSKRLEIENCFRTAAEALDYLSVDGSKTIRWGNNPGIDETHTMWHAADLETDEMLFKIKVHIVGRFAARSLYALQLLQLLKKACFYDLTQRE